MSISTSIVRRETLGGTSFRLVDVTLDNSYPSPGGWAVTPQQLGFGVNGRILMVWADAIQDGYLIMWDEAASKIKVFQGDNTNAAAAPGVELTNASAVMNNKVLRLCAFGDGHG
jgi:hypothetical protein